jgi:hypothetical protein
MSMISQIIGATIVILLTIEGILFFYIRSRDYEKKMYYAGIIQKYKMVYIMYWSVLILSFVISLFI